MEKEILDASCQQMKSMYKAMFKPTQNCRSPHVHLDSLRNHLFEFGIVRTIRADTSEDLYTWLINENDMLSKIKEEQWIALRGRATEKAVMKALLKAKKNKFFLGMPGAMGLVLGRGK